MSYIYEEKLVSSTKYNIKCPYPMTPKYVVIHDTANLASASNEIAYMTRNNNQVSFHLAVDEKYAIQGLPFNRNAWAAGDGGNGDGNRNGIHVEICRPTNSDRNLYNESEENAVYVAARLLNKFNLNISRLKKHQDFSGKKCPNLILSENRWENFKYRVDWVLSEIKKGNIEAGLSCGSTSLKDKNQFKSFKVKIICDSLNVRKEASFDSKVVQTVKRNEVFTIVDEKNGLYKLKSGVGWISANSKYVKKL